jgi:hypothetical protein
VVHDNTMTDTIRGSSGSPAQPPADAPPPLGPEDNVRLTEFARACKTAARAVVLYPPGHPAVAATLGRLVHLTSPASLPGPLRISVLAESLLLDGRAPVRPDAAIGELAHLLHAHVIGEVTVGPGGDAEAWREFLLLIGRSPDEVRAEGGVAKLWTDKGGRHIEIREIDYSEVLRERDTGEAAVWEQVIANCLQGDAFDLDERAIQALLEAAGDPERLAELVHTLDARATEGGRGGQAPRTAALLRLLQEIVKAATLRQPDRVETALQNMASTVGRLSPEMLVSILAQGSPPPGDAAAQPGANAALVDAVVSRMPDTTIAQFIARNAFSPEASLDRVAQALHTLVRDAQERERLLSLAHDEAASSPVGSMEGFEEVWENVAQKMLTSYSDKPYVSEQYAVELSGMRAKAIDVEHAGDDPRERVDGWLQALATSEVRKLDLTLVLDLLRIEPSLQHRLRLMPPVVALLEDLILVGDFDAAGELLATLLEDMRPETLPERRQIAATAVESLVGGQMLRHVITHSSTIDDGQFAKVKALCLALGDVIIRPLAEALAGEERARPRERLTDILIGFGAMGRRHVERLKTSPNPAVRRTAIYLLREFGGSDALAELTELLADSEAQVQREAVRAILRIGGERAYRVLEQALLHGTPQSREAIMQAIMLVRDERAAPLFGYILQHVDHRGQLGSIYLRAIDALGALKDPEGVAALKQALYKGEWWAPRRTAALRTAAAAALARIGTAEALGALEEASRAGPRGVRAAARAHRAGAPAARSAAR